MADVTWADVTGFASTLTRVSAGAQADILAYVNSTLNPDVYGGVDASKYRIARIYLAAHMGEINLRNGVGGAVTHESVGADSISFGYAAPYKGQIDSLETTSWGLEFQRITDTTYARLPVVT